MKKRLICLLLALLCTLPTIGCSGGDEETKETTPAENTANAETETETETELTDGLPETDMNGFAYHLLNTSQDSLTWADMRFLSEELDGEPVNDGLYNRRTDIQERFNCSITSEETIHYQEVPKHLQNFVNAGDGQYQSVFLAESHLGSALSYCSAWNSVPHLRYTEDHWNPNATSIFDLNGKQVALAGNVSLSVASRAVCMVFNKRIFSEHFSGDSLYEKVENNEWTLDTWLSYVSQAGVDLNGDGAWTVEDQYGLNMGRGFKGYLASFIGASGQHFTTPDANGVPELTMHTSEATLNLVTRLMDAMTATEGFYYNEDKTVHGFQPADFFSSGHALFTQGVPHDIYKLRDMEDDLGILPMPKLTQEQDKYYSASWGGHVLVLPKTVLPESDTGTCIGILLEAMSFAGYHDILPLYKEVALKSKTARDEESSAMLDIIYASAVFDFGTNILYDALLAPTVLQTLWDKKDSSIIVSTCTAQEKKIADYISDFMTAVEEMS